MDKTFFQHQRGGTQMRCTDCEYYRRGFCTKYEVSVRPAQRCVETGIKNKPRELEPHLVIENKKNKEVGL